ncbi:hypothetical protein [Plantactinospora sp. GCM10030261]|uniref:hypothetical protein n=1 Tax=Plantactinospora sp. GCM10030261 TaxID=3273420 RepID=UPI00361FE73F
MDLGPLAESWRSQPDTPVYGQPYAGGQQQFFGAPAVPAPADRITEALAAARR